MELSNSYSEMGNSEFLLDEQYEIIEYPGLITADLPVLRSETSSVADSENGSDTRELDTAKSSADIFEDCQDSQLNAEEMEIRLKRAHNSFESRNPVVKEHIRGRYLRQQLMNELKHKFSITNTTHPSLSFSSVPQSVDLPPEASNTTSIVPIVSPFKPRPDPGSSLELVNLRLEARVQLLLDYTETLKMRHASLESRHITEKQQLTDRILNSEDTELSLHNQLATLRCEIDKQKAENAHLTTQIRSQSMSNTPDFYTRSDEYFSAAVSSLNYQIKNWCRSVELPVSKPALMGVSGFLIKKLNGGKVEDGPDYSFLREVSREWVGYTVDREGFKWILQAYVWKRMVELHEDRVDVIGEDANAVNGFYELRSRLMPDSSTARSYDMQYHIWRSMTARLISSRLPPSHASATVIAMRNEILAPIFNAIAASTPARDVPPSPLTESSESSPVDSSQPLSPSSLSATSTNIPTSTFDDILTSFLSLEAIMSHQTSPFTFEFIPVAPSPPSTPPSPSSSSSSSSSQAHFENEEDKCCGAHLFNPQTMFSIQREPIDTAREAKVVQLTLAPGIVRFDVESERGRGAADGMVRGRRIALMEVEARAVARGRKRG